MTVLDSDLTATIWTTGEAAQAVGVDPGVIRIWAHRGHITRINRSGRPRYKALDVLRAEAATRQRAHRTHAA
jgi:hypothetical protein